MARIFSKIITMTALVVFLLSFHATSFGQSPSTDTQVQALQLKIQLLQLQNTIDALQAQKAAIEKLLPKDTAALSTEAQLAAVQNQLKLAQLQQQIDSVKAQQAALQRPSKPECVAASKKSAWRQRFEDDINKQLNKAGKKVDKASGGDGTQSTLPTTADITSAQGGCPDGMVPKKQ